MTINGAEPPLELKESILQVVVEESLHLPSVFTVAFENPFQPGYNPNSTFPIIQFVNSTLRIGVEVIIGFSNTQTDLDQFLKQDYKDDRLIVGEITAIEVPFSKRAQSPIIIRGYSYSHRLHRGRWNRSFMDTTDSDIATRIAGEAGIPLGQVDSSEVVHEYVFQENQTNMEFLRERASRIGFEVFVQEDLFYFRKPKGETVEDRVDWLNYALDNIKIRANSIEQIKEIEVRGWDYPNKEPFVANRISQSGSVITNLPEQETGEAKSSIFKPAEQTFYVVDQPVYQQIEADFIAQSCCDEIRGQYIHIDIEAEGDPRIRPGRTIDLYQEDFPEQFRGTYYITETRHVYEPDRERSYNTEFAVRGLRNSDLLTTLSPPNRLQPGQTFLIGLVTANMDPENMGRIKVMYPTLTEEHESHWARIVTFGAGDDRGIDWLPEINDEVVLAFEHGDIHRPLVIGSVWNGIDKPPEHITDSVTPGSVSASELISGLVDDYTGKVRLRTLRSREGQQIQFIDESKIKEHKPDVSEKGIRIATLLKGNNGEHKIYLNDESHYISIDTANKHHIYLKHPGQGLGGFDQPPDGEYIEIKTAGGHFVRLDDQNQYIEIKTSKGHYIKMDDASGLVDISSFGNMKIQAIGNIDITAGGIITVQGALIKLN
jgi:phage protein D